MDAILIKNGTVFDGTGADAQPNTSVLIEGNKVKALGPTDELDAGPDAKVVDATGKFVMPGMFNNHAHLGLGWRARLEGSGHAGYRVRHDGGCGDEHAPFAGSGPHRRA